MNLTESNFEEHVNNGVALVDFWAPWCGPCNMLAPRIDNLAKEMEGKAVVGKVNIDEEQALAAKYGISAIPALLYFKDGELQSQMMGLMTEDAMKTKIEELLQS